MEILNKLWEVEDLISNFFTPCAKLLRKELNQQSKAIRRVHDKPKTPFVRLMESKEIPMNIKFKLHKQKQNLSIVKLRKLSDKYKRELANDTEKGIECSLICFIAKVVFRF